MHTGLDIDGDESFDLAGSRSLIAGPPPGCFVSIGDLAAVICSDVSVRLSGDFRLPKLVIGGFPGGQKPADP